MSLDDWLASGLLVEHRTSRQEIANLFATVTGRFGLSESRFICSKMTMKRSIE